MTEPAAAPRRETQPVLRVLAVMPGFTPEAGAETSLAAVAPYLTRNGIELHLAVLTEVQQLVPAMREIGVVVHDLSAAKGLRAQVRAVRSLIRAEAIDVVHATLYDAAVPAQLAAVSTRCPVLVTWANTPVKPRENPNVGWAKLQAVRLIEVALGTVARTRFHAVTEGVARTNRRWLFVGGRRVRVAERGRDPARFAPRPKTHVAALRKELGIATRDRVVLTVGRQDVQKGHARLLAAFDAVVADHPDAVLLLAGREGSASAAVQAQHQAMAHPDRVRFLGHRDDIPLLLQLAEVSVCSSVREGAAGALIEAMAVGTPIVTTRVEGLDGVLTNGVNALVVDGDGLGAGIAAALDDRDAALARAARAKADFERRFTVDRAAAALGDVYRWAARREVTATGAVRVQHVMWRLSRSGGVQTVVRELISALDPQRVSLSVLTLRPRLEEDRLEELAVPVEGVARVTGRVGALTRVRVMGGVARRVRAARPNVVQLHSGTVWLGLLLPIASRRSALVVEVHDAPGSGRHGERTDRFEGWFARRSGATVVCHSSSVRADVLREWRLPEDRVVTFPLAVDVEWFAGARHRRAAAREARGIPSDDVVLLGVGRLVPSKSFDRAVRALADLDASATLLLVGDGPEREGLERLAVDAGVAGRVNLTGTLTGEPLRDAYAAADVLVSPSAYEGFGLAVVEAMAAGIPVVVDAVGGTTDTVVDGETGIAVPTGDDAALVAALTSLVNDRTLRGRLGAAGSERAEALYTRARFAAAFTDLYEGAR